MKQKLMSLIAISFRMQQLLSLHSLLKIPARVVMFLDSVDKRMLQFPETKVGSILQRSFRDGDAVKELCAWKLYGEDSGKTLCKLTVACGKTFCKLTVACKTYLATSGECERGFSALNDTETKSRNRLRVQSLARCGY
ncbi:UNVERIFIED_CONTAM: hypothetical protein FKN15_038807 [Acipenser sinensis]